MRRADRLFRLVQILRRRKLCRACDLAEELEVSERTIYRDIRDLAASGVPVEGEAGAHAEEAHELEHRRLPAHLPRPGRARRVRPEEEEVKIIETLTYPSR